MAFTNAKNETSDMSVSISTDHVESFEYAAKTDVLVVNLRSGRQHQLKGRLAAETLKQLRGPVNEPVAP